MKKTLFIVGALLFSTIMFLPETARAAGDKRITTDTSIVGVLIGKNVVEYTTTSVGVWAKKEAGIYFYLFIDNGRVSNSRGKIVRVNSRYVVYIKPARSRRRGNERD